MNPNNKPMTAEEYYDKYYSDEFNHFFTYEIGIGDVSPKKIIEAMEAYATYAQSAQQQPQVSDWISVEAKLPEVGKDYLVTDGYACMVAAFRIEKQEWDFWNIEWWSNDTVTHWMPLPEPPQFKSKQKGETNE